MQYSQVFRRAFTWGRKYIQIWEHLLFCTISCSFSFFFFFPLLTCLCMLSDSSILMYINSWCSSSNYPQYFLFVFLLHLLSWSISLLVYSVLANISTNFYLRYIDISKAASIFYSGLNLVVLHFSSKQLPLSFLALSMGTVYRFVVLRRQVLCIQNALHQIIYNIFFCFFFLFPGPFSRWCIQYLRVILWICIWVM